MRPSDYELHLMRQGMMKPSALALELMYQESREGFKAFIEAIQKARKEKRNQSESGQA